MASSFISISAKISSRDSTVFVNSALVIFWLSSLKQKKLCLSTRRSTSLFKTSLNKIASWSKIKSKFQFVTYVSKIKSSALNVFIF